MRHCRAMIWIGVAMLAAATTPGSLADGGRGVPTVVADFDYYDTSGEARDQAAEHTARVRAFAGLLRQRLAAGGKYDVRPMECPQAACSAGGMDPDDLVQVARRAGARLLVYGGIHKMSTLVQWGKVQVVDLRGNELLLDRTFSFRGDDDRAFRRAAEFVLRYLQDLEPKT